MAVVSLDAVGASMSENPSDSLSASPASPELMRVCRWSGEEEAEKEDTEGEKKRERVQRIILSTMNGDGHKLTLKTHQICDYSASWVVQL